MRRRAYDSFLVTSGAKEHDLLSKDELKFLQAAEIGDFPTVKAMLENEEKAAKLLRCTDYKDRTALEVSTENEHLEIVELLVQRGGRKLEIQCIHESLMLAISKGYLRITQALLNHPVHQRSKDKFRLGSLTNYYQRKNNSKFDQDVTPLMLAAHCNEIDIIRLLLNRGDSIKKPHNSLCQCTYCSNKKQFDPLKHSLAGFNTYRALASPAYIALTSPDPILSAFLLSQELASNARIEKEFKNEYRDLAKQCKEFASDLLDMCQNSEEVRTILNQGATTMEESEHERATSWLKTDPKEDSHVPSLARLKLAIKLRQKQFVAHAHCQHELATLWYRNFPSWRLMGLMKKVSASISIVLGLPFFTLVYYLAPHSKCGAFVSSPLVKFILHSASYFLFLLIIFIESLYAQSYNNSAPKEMERRLTSALRDRGNTSCLLEVFPDLVKDPDYVLKIRFNSLTPLEILVIIFLIGFLWGEIKQLWAEGLWVYLSSVWNWIDIAMLNFYLASCTLNIYSIIRAQMAIDFIENNLNATCEYASGRNEVAKSHFYYLQRERGMWQNNDPVFVSEALYAMANVLSFSRLSYILPVSEFLGPLQISLGRMLGDILRFAVVFFVVFLAFFCSLFNLYYSYEDSKFGDFGTAFLTLFWALFGLGNPLDPRLNGTTLAISVDEFGNGRGGFLITESFGTILYMTYYVVMGLVMLNMLIAMMSNSFQEINSEQDVEWKFARAQLWMSYFDQGATIPVPFNLIPSPKSFTHFYKWVAARILEYKNGRSSAESTQVPLGERRNGVFNILNRLELRREESTHESIMKGIIKRYLFKLQREKDSDEVNEGELDEIKNDISSLRFELMEQLKTPRTPFVPHAPASAPAFTFSFPSGHPGKPPKTFTDPNVEISALRRQISELSTCIETLTKAVLSKPMTAKEGSAGTGDVERTDVMLGCETRRSENDDTHLEYDLVNRTAATGRTLDMDDIVVTYNSEHQLNREMGVASGTPSHRRNRYEADHGRDSLRRAYGTCDDVSTMDQDSGYNHRTMSGSRPGDHNPEHRRWSMSTSPNNSRGGTTADLAKHGISRTLSRGSIHVGFDLETRHDPVLSVLEEANGLRREFEPQTSRPSATARTPVGTPGLDRRDYDGHADDAYSPGRGVRNNRVRCDVEDDVPSASAAHYNIAFSLDA
ncbi:short transient receptor potential channel 7-like [Diadema antillarum]|uniref:short transient receptor potential channel 7-like n=1 Tax=Diadema antillarum TaxID=105358 RepID=UPI003A83A5E6